MSKTFGALIRQLRVQQGQSVRGLAHDVRVSPAFLSDVERGKRPPPGEEKIARLAHCLGQNPDVMLALAGKVPSDIIEIILQRPQETTALLRRLSHASPAKLARHTETLPPSEPVDFYPLETISRENHTAVIGESGSGKSLLTKYLIHSYFGDADVRVYDSDAAPDDWGTLEVIGQQGSYGAIAHSMQEDVEELQRRTVRHGAGQDCGGDIVRVIEEYPTTAAELAETEAAEIGLVWLRRLLRRGRKYRMKVFAVAQEFEVNAWKIAGEGGLRRAFTVLYLGATSYQALTLIKDKKHRERLRLHLESVAHPCLVDVKGRFYPAAIPDLSVFSHTKAA